jgi:L-ascorbate metabolism protein UlaG (beta-lactamase superfamily)
VALIPIGAYEPKWYVGGQHVDPEEAIRIMQDCGARQAFGHHWGTFQLTWEAVNAPPRALAAALAAKGVPPDRFPALHPGQPVETAWPPAG